MTVLSIDTVDLATLRWFHDNASHGIFTTDTDLRVRSWNQWLAVATGCPESEVQGRPLFELFPSLVERGVDQHYLEALQGQVKVLSHSLHRFILPAKIGPDGVQMPQRGQIAPLTDGERIVGTITQIEDVSERVATERELRARIVSSERARATAEAASRVKDEFLATLSHEIRTPLNAVLGWTRILRSRAYDKDTVQRAVDVIDRNASAQLTLISDMLDMARIAAGKVRLEMAPIDLDLVTLAAVDVVRPAADAKGVTLVTEVSPRACVLGDRDRLLQVIWNLLSNAVKFTDSGGRVTIGVVADSSTVRLRVTDTGQGIPPAFLSQVFERFKQADSSSARRHGGLGLGLALVRELVELHGGSVRASSEGPGQGSTFTVELPARGDEAAANSVVRRMHQSSSILDGVHILIVEDDPDAREIIVRSVTDVGASVTAVGSVHEALAVLESDDGALTDIVVTDIGMADQDGFTLLKELRKLPVDRGGRLPAIAVTAYATIEDRQRALDAGFTAHVSKPFTPLALVSTIAGAVTRRPA